MRARWRPLPLLLALLMAGQESLSFQTKLPFTGIVTRYGREINDISKVSAVGREDTRKPPKKEVYQSSNRKGWRNMAIYWISGHIIGLKEGYISNMLHLPSLTLGIPFAAVLAGTLLCQRELNTRYSKFERKVDYVGTTLFALANGIYESFFFLFAYDLGRKYIAAAFSLSEMAAISVGWCIYILYASIIHIGFWLPFGLPKHTKGDAPPFQKRGLPLLFIISILWFSFYEAFNDVTSFCIFHCAVDAWVALNIGLQSPWKMSFAEK